MKKFIMLVMVLILSGCFTAGDFPEKRERLHNMGHEDDYCQKNPDRCINGVQW